MSRPAGSKNRATLIKELVERGAEETDLVNLEYLELEQLDRQALAVQPAPTAVERKILIDPSQASDTVKQVGAQLHRMVEYFAPGGMDKNGHLFEIPTELTGRLRRIYVAKNNQEASSIAKSVIDTLFLRLLWLQRQKAIAGPATGDFRIWVP